MWKCALLVIVGFCSVSRSLQAGSITLAGQGTVSLLQNATMQSDSSTTSQALTSSSVSLTWNGIVSWIGTRGTTKQTINYDYYLEFDVNWPTQISNLTISGDYKWVNGGGNFIDPASKNAALVEIYQYVDANNNGHYDNGETIYPVPVNGGTAFLTVTGNGYGLKTSSYTDPTPYVLGPNTHYILLAEIYDTSTFSVTNNGDPDNIYTAEFPSPSFGGITASFNYLAVPEPGCLALIAIAGTSTLMRRRGGASLTRSETPLS